jgi:hypothetical protein
VTDQRLSHAARETSGNSDGIGDLCLLDWQSVGLGEGTADVAFMALGALSKGSGITQGALQAVLGETLFARQQGGRRRRRRQPFLA